MRKWMRDFYQGFRRAARTCNNFDASKGMMQQTLVKSAMRLFFGSLLSLHVTLALASTFDDGVAAYARRDYAAALRIFHLLSEQSNAEAEYNIGLMSYSGQGVPQDYAEAIKWYRTAAAHGSAKAGFNLGLMYEKGLGSTQDYAEAAKWYLRAANQGHSKAQTNLGRLYDEGLGVPQDYVLAHMWFNLAATQGHQIAKKTGTLLRNG
jgi:TPR repeat protein